MKIVLHKDALYHKELQWLGTLSRNSSIKHGSSFFSSWIKHKTEFSWSKLLKWSENVQQWNNLKCQQTNSFSAHRPEHAVTRPSDQSDQSALLADDSSTLTLSHVSPSHSWVMKGRLQAKIKLVFKIKRHTSCSHSQLYKLAFVSPPLKTVEHFLFSSAVMRLMWSFSLSQQPHSLVLFLHVVAPVSWRWCVS